MPGHHIKNYKFVQYKFVHYIMLANRFRVHLVRVLAQFSKLIELVCYLNPALEAPVGYKSYIYIYIYI